MKISLITVSFNSEGTIRQTFESVRDQKIEGFELEYIHVDGLSNDQTMNISNEYDDIVTNRISEKDSGIYNAMNKGIQMATGDVIGFLNSDDTFSGNEVLKRIAATFKKHRNSSVVHCDINYIDDKGIIKRKWRSGQQKSFSSGWHPAHPGFYAKKELFNKYGGFDERLTITADFDLMLRFLEVANAHSVYLNMVAVDMKLGGESNKSFENIKIGSHQILESFAKYKIKPQFMYTYRRWWSKILQSF